MDILQFNAFLENYLQDTANSVGLDVGIDQIKLLFCLFSAYPLGYIFSLLPNNPTIKHVMSLGIGFWFGWFTLGPLVLHTTVSSLVTYLLLVAFDIRKGFVHKLVFAWGMLYLSASHIYRMYTDYLGWSMDFTGPQMLLTLKLTTFAFDYYDGTRPVEKLNGHQKEMAFTQFPSFLEYWSYIYFFPGFLAGPAFNFREFREFMNLDAFKTNKGRMPSGRVLLSFRKLIESLVLLVFVIWGMQYKVDYMRTPEFFSQPFFYRLFYIWFATGLTRFPYYFAWTLAEGACMLSGIAYSGTDEKGNAKWDRAVNVRVFPFELAQNLRGCTENWNIRTDKWLKHYIYERVPKFNVGLTFLCSSVWHGFYPGYYLSFMSASLMIVGMRIIRRNIQSRFVTEDGKPKALKPVYDLITLVGTSTVLGYLMSPFKILGGVDSWRVWSSVYFFGHVVTFAAVVFAIVLGAPRRPRTAKIDDKTKAH